MEHAGGVVTFAVIAIALAGGAVIFVVVAVAPAGMNFVL